MSKIDKWAYVTDKTPKYGQKVEVRFFEKGGNLVVADAVRLSDCWAVDYGEHGDVFDIIYWRPRKENEGDNDDEEK